MKFQDKATPGTVKKTSDGYLVATAKALRSGIQLYTPEEFGLMRDGYPDGYVRVFRPESSVKDADSLMTMAHAPVTMGHPDDDVNPDNWRELAVGEVSTRAQWDGDFISFDLMLKDKAAIEAVETGKTVELSAGYVADMVEADHPDYDFIMGPPRYNHLAIVDNARAGHEARIGDSAKPWGAAPLTKPDKKEPEMDTVKVMVGDKAVTVAADDADIVTKLATDLAKEKEAHAATKIEAADAAKQIKSDEEVAQMVQDGVKELATVTEKAGKLVKDYDAAGKDAMTIRKEVIQKVYGDEAIADLNTDAEIKAAFAVARSEYKADPVKAALGDAKGKEKDDPWAKFKKEKK